MDEYIEKLLSQIRFTKARKPIEEELRAHLEEQTACYIKGGADRKAAEAMAVSDMGDPIETGIALDRIHRPKMDHKFIVLVILLSILSLLLQTAMKNTENNHLIFCISRRQLLYTTAGLLLMMGVCYLDYTWIADFARAGACAVSLLLLLLLLAPQLDHSATSIWHHLSKPGGSGAAPLLTFLYIPFFGGILYRYKDQAKKGLLKSFLWMAVPIIAAWSMANIAQMISLFTVMVLQISYAMWKGWFGTGKRSAIICGTSTIWLPLLSIGYILIFTNGFKRRRLLAFYPWLSKYIRTEYSAVHYVPREPEMMHDMFRYDHAAMASTVDINNYMIRFIFSYFGILAACLFVLLLAYFVSKLFSISVKQKNQLGQVIGIGCSLTFAVQIVFYLLINMDLLPRTDWRLPLFSHELTECIVSYMLLGVLLSIYRYQNICAANPGTPLQKKLL